MTQDDIISPGITDPNRKHATTNGNHQIGITLVIASPIGRRPASFYGALWLADAHLDGSANDLQVHTLAPSPSILVTIKQRVRICCDSQVFGPHESSLQSRQQPEGAMKKGRRALGKHVGRYHLGRSVEQFKLLLNTRLTDCPRVSTGFVFRLAHNVFVDAPLTVSHGALIARPIGPSERSSALIPPTSEHSTHLYQAWDDHNVLGNQEPTSSLSMHQLRTGHRMDHVPPGTELLHRFERFGDLADLQQAISHLEAFTPVANCRYLAIISSLGMALWNRFVRLGELRDLEQGIFMLQATVDLVPFGHLERPIYINRLCISLITRFQCLGQPSDLEQAIVRLRHALQAIPEGRLSSAAACFGSLGKVLTLRSKFLSNPGDIQEAISSLKQALYLTPDNHPDKPRHLNNLGLSFRCRFSLFAEFSDIEQATSRLKSAVDLAPDGHPHKPGYLHDLGVCFLHRYLNLGEPSDLEEGISRCQDAVDLTPDGHFRRHVHTSSLSILFCSRFQRFGELSDLDRGISMLRDTIDLIPHGYPFKACVLCTLGFSFLIRFGRLGDLHDLERAISTHQNAVDITPDGRPNKPWFMYNLGKVLFSRFRQLGELHDLERAVSTLREINGFGHPQPCILSSLGVLLVARFERLGELSDLEEAISWQEISLGLTHFGYLQKANHLNDLGNSFYTRFKCLGELADLEKALTRHKDAIDRVSDSYPSKPFYLDRYGKYLKAHFDCLGDVESLEDAISKQKDAVDLTPQGHPNEPSYLLNLATSFMARFKHLGEHNDLERAISLFSRAACAPVGPITIRFRASREWISSAGPIRHHTLRRAYSVAIDLLPQLAWIGFSLTHRYNELVQGANIVLEAAGAALDLEMPETAVEWLEQGRSVVWRELLQLRSASKELSSAYPDHAYRLRALSTALEHANRTRGRCTSLRPESLEQENNKHRALAIERDTLLQEIRGFPGFDRFLLHKEFTQLRTVAQSGPVVILNAAESRCDALIILANKERVVHVPLPTFTRKRTIDLQSALDGLLGAARDVPSSDRAGRLILGNDSRWESLLSTLWKLVVKPVLDALGFSAPGNMSRIFWCPTGPFTFLPIHAAGLYGAQHSEPGYKVFDFVISSYVSTLSILTPPIQDTTPSGNLRILIVPQPSSDGQSRLPGVLTELEHIRAILNTSPARTTLLESSVGSVGEVLGLMKDVDWVHFACHGVQDLEDPSNSGLCLAGGRRLTLSDMTSLSRPPGGLAFLSACQTAMGDKKLSDEAIHIAAGMLYAGYAGVIGTMWSISDRVAPDVAKDVYEQLFRTEITPDYREAARALHNAVGHLRDNNASFIEWVPFIHVGL